MRIDEYPEVVEMLQDDVLLIDGVNGTRTIEAKNLAKALFNMLEPGEIGSILALKNSDMLYDLLDPIIPLGVRQNLFRGKDLGPVVTDEQWNEIQNGTFRGMFLGDYWNKDNRWWRIADFDYWLGTGDTKCDTHHVVIIPDRLLYSAKFNDTNDTTGAYVNSKLRASNLNEAYNIVYSVFEEAHILLHRELLSNHVNSEGTPDTGNWYNSRIDIPNEVMIYGEYFLTPHGLPQAPFGYPYTNSTKALALMQNSRKWATPYQETNWLRDIITNTSVCATNNRGYPQTYSPSTMCGVRPVFGICK